MVWCNIFPVLKPLRLSIASPLPPGPRRQVLSLDEAENLERVFSILASSTRLRLLHAITQLGSPCMSDLASAVGMKPQAVSNQLRKLLDMGILRSRRHGNHIHYRLEHAGVKALLVHGLEISRRSER